MPRRKDPQSTFGESLKVLFERYRDSIEQASGRLSSEAVHDARVASRRLMAGLDVVHVLLRSKKAARIQDEVKEGLEGLGPLRDVHVQLKLAEAESKSSSIKMKKFVGKLERKEKRLNRAGAHELSRIEARRLKKPIAAFSRQFERPLDNIDPEYFLSTLNSIVDLTFPSVVRRTEALRLRQPQTFHRLRVRLKNFRYLLEFLGPVLDIPEARIERTKRFQDALGEIHDLMVFVDKLERFFSGKGPIRENAVLRRFKDRLDSKLHLFMASAGEVAELWPAAAIPAKPPASKPLVAV